MRLYRLSSALPLLAALQLVSCSGEAKPASQSSSEASARAPVSIVGTWEAVSNTEHIVRKTFKTTKPTATEDEIAAAVKSLDEQARARGGIPTQTYRADGTGEQSGLVFDHAIKDPFTWKLVEATPERIVIDAWTEAKVESRMTFLVESPDVLVYADKPMKGEKIVRVK